MSESEQIVWEPKGEEVVKSILKMKQKYSIDELKAIELYAGDGHTLSDKMAEHCVSFIAYDIDPSKEEGFKKNVINGKFQCKDSVKMIRTIREGEIGNYNLISADGPICIYGDNYCEHFEVLKYIYKLIAKDEKVLCVFPVVPKPYDTEKPENAAWMKRRQIFYKTNNKNLDLDQVIEIYNSVFEEQNLDVLASSYVCREYRNGVDWMYEFVYVLQKG